VLQRRAGERFGRARGGFAGCPLLILNTGLGEMIAALDSRGTTDHVFPLVVLVLLPSDMGSLVARE
jgi:sulfopyruvate decarboxylase TPP-binding subunit